MKKINHYFLLLGILFISNSCANFGGYYNHLSYQKSQSSSKKEVVEIEKDTPETSQLIESHTPFKKPIYNEPIASERATDSRDLEKQVVLAKLTEKSIKSSVLSQKYRFKELEKAKAANPPCSTIVLTNGTTISARDIKVTGRDVSFKTCGENPEILFVPRNTVERIIATTDADRIVRGVSEGRIKDRYNNVFSILYFIGTLIACVLATYLMATGFMGTAFILSLLATGVGCFLLITTLTDLSTIRGVTFIIAGFVLNTASAVVGGILVLYERIY